MAITDLQLAKKISSKKEKWLSDASARGAGQFCVRIVGSNKPVFYFRYTDNKGKQERVNIGKYDKSGNVGLTLKDARAKAGEFSLLYQSGVKDIKGYLEAEQRRVEAERIAEEARLEAERKSAEVEASRMTVTTLFEKWEKAYLNKKHKDKGVEARRIFEKDVFDVIGDMPAHLVRRGDVMTIVDNILERCQSALKIDPPSASNFDPPQRVNLGRCFLS